MNSSAQPSQTAKLTLNDVIAALRRQLRLILICCAVCLALGIAYLVVAHTYYSATSRVEIEGGDTTLGLDRTASSSLGDALAVNNFLQTQAQLLQSETIALRVIKELNLEQAPGFKTSDTPAQGQGPALESSPKRMDHAIEVFRRNLSVQVVPTTHLLDVHFTARDPERAAQVVNHAVGALIAHNFETRFKATADTSGWLNDQLTTLRKHSEDLQAQVLAMQQQAGVLSSSALNAQGQPETFSPALDRVRGASEALQQAQTNTILKKAIDDIARSGNAETISTLSGTALANSSPGVNNSFTVLQNLRGQEATLQQQIDQARTKYGPRFPRLVELQSSLDAISRSIKQEVQRISQRASNDYRIAQVTENAERQIYDRSRRSALDLNGKAAEYGLVRQEAEQSRKLYDDLLSHLQEAGILQGLHATNITVVDQARAPSKAARPNKLLILAAAIALGAFLGLLCAFGAETLGDKVVSARSVENVTGGQSLARLPLYSGGAPSRNFLEAIRALRARLLGSPDSAAARVVLITSATEREGKSQVALGLARSLAQQGRRVLLVDSNLRQPSLGLKPGGTAGPGLAEALENNAAPLVAATSDLPALHLLGSGRVTAASPDLLDSPVMDSLLAQWRSQYEFVILDSAAVLSYSDALPLAGMADYTLLVVRESALSRAQLQASAEALLGVVPGTKVGTVLNAAKS